MAFAPVTDLLSSAQGVRSGTAAADGWVGNPVAWDTLKVAGEIMPGVARVDPEREYEVDRKRTAGADGATLTGFGHMPAKVKINLRLWSDEQFQRFKNILPTIFPKPKKGRPVPVDVSHPALSVLGIRSLYFTKISAPRPSSTPGVFEVPLEAVEFLPVSTANITLTPNQSAASGDALAGINYAGASGKLPLPPINPLDTLLSNGLLPPSEDSSDTGP